jgi:hypothetical protein
MRSTIRNTLLAVALATAGAAAAQAPGTADVIAIVRTQGYTDVDSLVMGAEGLWHAQAREDDGTWREIRIDPNNGRVLTGLESQLDEDEVRERILARGFTEVREVNWNDGVWEVEAVTPAGQRVDLMLEPDDAEVMAEVSDTD